MLTLYGIKNCDKCRAARKALSAKDIAHKFHDMRTDGLSAGDIKRWLAQVDMDILLNRRGTTWRNLSDKDKAQTTAAALIALMVAHPTLIKRPICERAQKITVGWTKEIEASLT
ncbi:MAG: Spx/MgsR family RNA polymerase-binding regulatory protein [Alphaproteobacteria bacterium]|nr:Spx/MgsR family RNA polymerase-binding regulatory protein [Alphaproteobacteria bacterium]MBE8220484.1 Spx/MgsR family RNA polymerase-binding regulatory protein [Alphaproteobacteria bacterium]